MMCSLTKSLAAMIISGYNASSRFFVALDVAEMKDAKITKAKL
jgi:hypothetical protein